MFNSDEYSQSLRAFSSPFPPPPVGYTFYAIQSNRASADCRHPSLSAQWMRMERRPNITLVNIIAESNCPLPQLIADGSLLPIADNEFDIAFSSSVIEHVGYIDSQKAFANEVMRVAQHFCLQTPNR